MDLLVLDLIYSYERGGREGGREERERKKHTHTNKKQNKKADTAKLLMPQYLKKSTCVLILSKVNSSCAMWEVLATVSRLLGMFKTYYMVPRWKKHMIANPP